MYYRGAQAAIIVYDITNAVSFDRAKSWVNELNEQANSVKVIALAGNKLDLEEHRTVSTESAQTYATENGLIFMETSAKTATNVVELFTAVALRLPRDAPVAPGGGQQLTEGNGNAPARRCCR
jgi:small GTP-binding protein